MNLTAVQVSLELWGSYSFERNVEFIDNFALVLRFRTS